MTQKLVGTDRLIVKINVYVVFAFRDALTLVIVSLVVIGHTTPAGAFGVYWGATHSATTHVSEAMVTLLDGVNEPCRVRVLLEGFHWADTLLNWYWLLFVSYA